MTVIDPPDRNTAGKYGPSIEVAGWDGEGPLQVRDGKLLEALCVARGANPPWTSRGTSTGARHFLQSSIASEFLNLSWVLLVARPASPLRRPPAGPERAGAAPVPPVGGPQQHLHLRPPPRLLRRRAVGRAGAPPPAVRGLHPGNLQRVGLPGAAQPGAAPDQAVRALRRRVQADGVVLRAGGLPPVGCPAPVPPAGSSRLITQACAGVAPG
nr:uncharacterized protein LOC113820960 [Penaeus vannamei]